MINLSSPELFINIKRVPDVASKEYKAFWKAEKQKVIQGITINGARFPGWLYWHINHWHIDIDKKEDNPNYPVNYIQRVNQRPDLRDNEWIIGEGIERAEKKRSGLLIIGTRQLGKTEFNSSYAGRRMIGFKNSQNIIAGLSSPDLVTLTSKLDKGLVQLHPYFRPLRIKDNWGSEVVLGYKDRQTGERNTYSQLLIRNLDKGTNTEELAGPSTSSLIIDEIGKGDWLEAFIAAQPALETEFGWRCSPVFTGTSGSFDKAKDLITFYGKLKEFNFISIECKDETEKSVHFFPGTQASRAKRQKIRMSAFLGMPLGQSPELDITAIKVVKSTKEEVKRIKHRRTELEKTGKSALSKKETMYYPLNNEELFLTEDKDNPFNDIKQLAKDHLKYLESINIQEEYGWMIRSDGKPKFVPAEKNQVPIQEFPTGDREEKDCPIIIWDHPLPGQEFGILHVSGADPYNQDESYYSPSLGSFYIFRRTYDPLNGKFQQQFVACYNARPKSIGRWQEQVRLLLEYYQATCLPENEEASFIRYFDNKHLAHYIEDGIDLAKEINPETKVKRKKGLAATPSNISYGNGLLKGYCDEDLVIGQDPNGDPIIQKGIIRIKDKLLLKEIIAYKVVKVNEKDNFDRVVAARHALILANAKDKFHPVSKLKPQVDPNAAKPEKRIPHSPFANTSSHRQTYSVFSVRKSPFRKL